MDKLPSRSIVGPSGMTSPIVAHIPHASTVIPPEVRARLLVSDEALARELVRMTDWHTDTLFAFTGRLGATRLVIGRGERDSPATNDLPITMRLAEPPQPFDWLRCA